MKKELKDIMLDEGITAEEFLKTVPEKHKQNVITVIYDILKLGIPLHEGEIQWRARELYVQQHLKDYLE
ncbi:MAG: hypothetical protein J6Y72_01430 [Bacteroidales bacterium]|nr:hypothetical protein [Bacteroidales bacterium]MBR6249766.1 hypothetical protein [Bacteroidales bacterium]